MAKRILASLPLLLLLPACANYDFARARLPNGGWDHQKLIADLKESGEDVLIDITWIPLIYMDVKSFRASKPHLPSGYTLQTGGGVGPLFCVGWEAEQVITDDATFVESEDGTWVGWGLGYRGWQKRVATPFGDRLSDRHRVALLFGTRGENVLYLDGKFLEKVLKQESKANPPNPPAAAETVQ